MSLLKFKIASAVGCLTLFLANKVFQHPYLLKSRLVSNQFRQNAYYL